MERMDECLKDMEKSCSLNPDFPSASAQKCYIQYRCGLRFNDENQKEAALKGFAELEKKYPNCSETLFLYAQVCCFYIFFSYFLLFFFFKFKVKKSVTTSVVFEY